MKLHPLLRLLAALFLLCPVFAFAEEAEEAPLILFITENVSARVALEQLVTREFNAIEREKIRLAGDLQAWADYQDVEFRGIPRAHANERLAYYLALFGLEESDPADKGFTDMLESFGYRVVRSWTEREEDPITGAFDEIHQFRGSTGQRLAGQANYFLDQDQIDLLNSADLIVMSRNIASFFYAAGGLEGGVTSFRLKNQWNSITTPIIIHEPVLAQTQEFGGWGWGLSYGFVGNWTTLAPFNREAIQGSERFVFPDLRPKLRQNNPVLLDGIELVDDNRALIYKPFDELPFTSTSMRKFENNRNFAYPSNAQVILEFAIPSFVNAVVGNIEHQNAILIEFTAGVRGFTPEAGVPELARVGTPAGPRLFFAAGLNHGLFNLSADGIQLYLNAVEKYAGPASGGGVDPDPVGWISDPLLGDMYRYGSGWMWSATLGFLQGGNAPWLFNSEVGYLTHIAGSIDSGAWFYHEDGIFLWVHIENEGIALIADGPNAGTILSLTGN